MASEIAILNADHYVGAAGLPQLQERTASVKRGTTTIPSRPRGTQDAPRKKAKRSTAAFVTPPADMNEDVEEEGTKRARGRPRLNITGQETAADRRRTQIRLAQRAYRSRKENAIQSLEKKLQGLQETNEEIGNAFMKLHDCAMAHGVLDMAPGFARELRSTTESIISLVKRLDGSDGADDGQTGSVKHSALHHLSSSFYERQTYRSSSPEVAEGTEQPEKTGYPPVLGYNFTTESDMISSFPTTDATPNVSDSSVTNPKPAFYCDVNMPIFDDAGFHYPVTADTTVFPDLASHTPPPDPNSPFPYSSLPLPRTFSYHEATLSRRLSRLSLERGYRLITMTDPPKSQFARSFGFSLLFQPVEKIRERLRLSLIKSRNESLLNWQAPFWALGGAGQHGDSPLMLPPHPPDADATTVSGGSNHHHNNNNSTGEEDAISPLTDSVCANGYVYGVSSLETPADAAARHHLGTNRRFGPFDAKTAGIEANHIDSRMRMKMPGFEGDFFDASDVEQYLRVRGVVVQPGQDYVTAEVDVSLFGVHHYEQQQQQREGGDAGRDSRRHGADRGAGSSQAPGAGSPPSSPPAVFPWNHVSPPPPPPRNSTPLGGGAGAGAGGGGGGNGGDFGTAPGVFNNAGIIGADYESRQERVPLTFAHGNTRRRLITLDISRFISELSRRGVCLGRTSGYRPRDVINAFWKAVRSNDDPVHFQH